MAVKVKLPDGTRADILVWRDLSGDYHGRLVTTTGKIWSLPTTTPDGRQARSLRVATQNAERHATRLYSAIGTARSHSRMTHASKRAPYKIGQTVRLPDGPSGKLVRIVEGTEFGDPVYYLTVVNALGQEVTRWVSR